MVALLPLLVFAVSLSSSAPADLAQTATPKNLAKHGAYDIGLALELPIVGPLGSAAPGSQASWGYNFGLGLSYDIAPEWRARLAVNKSHTSDGRGYISFASGPERSQLPEVQQWDAWLMNVGGAYVWRGDWVVPALPYGGVDFVWGYGGYTYQYDASANNLLASPPTQSPLAPPMTHVAQGWLFGAALRAGLELALLPWLHTVSEVGAAWLPVGGVLVSNNRDIRDVRTASQSVFLPYFVFGVRAIL